jgi:hypothetical protein
MFIKPLPNIIKPANKKVQFAQKLVKCVPKKIHELPDVIYIITMVGK